ncbi:MAG: T9SS type B sorting domain-containing protein [Limnohabitans sp.]|nr:T9SS type B sorting domain-containing protein [Limnohabitans sp.]
MPNYYKLLLQLTLLLSLSSNAQIISGNTFIKGNYVEVGVNQSGGYGTDIYAPSDYHPRLNGSSARNLGFVADPQKDGWAIGSPSYYGDFFYPGTKQEGFSVQFNGSVYHNWTSGFNDIIGSNTSLVTGSINTTATWEGERNGLKIIQKTIVPLNEVYFVVQVEFKNTTSTTINDVYYVRTLDPDNEVTLTGDYETRNQIAYTLPNANNNTLVTAKGTSITDCYLGLGTKDCRAKPFIIRYSLMPNTNDLISGIHDNTNTNYQYTGENTADQGIGLSFKIGNIAAGESKKIALAYILKESDLDLALAQTIAQINIGPEILTNNHNYSFCENQTINLSIANGDNYVWHWTPESYFSSPYATNVTLQVPNTPVNFTLTGTSDCTPVTYNFSITPSTYQSNLKEINHVICSGSSTSYNPLAGVTTPTSTITWYNAAVGGSVIGTTPNFNTGILTNTSPTPVEYIYYYVEKSIADCESKRIPFKVKVYNSLDLDNAVLKKCTTNNSLITNFDLTEYQNLIAPINNATYSYYTSMSNLTNNIPITNTTNYTNITNNQIIYVKIEVNATCFDIIELTLKVFPQIITNQADIYGCDDDEDQKMIHNLTSVNSVINNNPDSVFSYYLTQANAEQNINPITNPTAYTNLINPQIIYVRISNDNCTNFSTITLHVNTPPKVNTGKLTECQKNLDGTSVFNLNSSIPQFSSATLTYSFYTSLANLNNNISITNSTTYTNVTNPQIIYVKALNPATNCYSVTQLTLDVVPTIINTGKLTECQTNLDGTAVFNLNSSTPQFSSTTLTYSFYTSLANLNNNIPITNSTTYTNVSNPQTIYVKAVNPVTNCLSVTQLTLDVVPVNKYTSSSIFKCDNDFDGFVTFNLADYASNYLAVLPADTYTYTYFLSENDAFLNINAINQVFTNTSSPQKIYVRAKGLTGCVKIISYELIVLAKPNLTIDENRILCENSFITLDAGPGFNSYLWSTSATTQSIRVTEEGDYLITVSNNYGSYSCETTKTIHVKKSSKAIINNIEINDWTDFQNTITVYVNGYGDYEYSIDNINFQSSSSFENLSNGVYTIYVRDKNGCGLVNKEFYVLMYPKFFTPNNDGYNDYWNVKFSKYEPNLKVTIFDRYGKLITQFYGNDQGWDGKLNGESLPATDYWFVVDRKDGKQFKGHFALKR